MASVQTAEALLVSIEQFRPDLFNPEFEMVCDVAEDFVKGSNSDRTMAGHDKVMLAALSCR